MDTTSTAGIITLAVTGMTCGSCKRHVESALGAVDGVAGAEVDVASGRATVAVAGATAERLMEAVRQAGYGAELATAAESGATTAPAACGCCSA